MKNNFYNRTLFSLFLLLLLASFSFIGCNSNKNASNKEDQTNTVSVSNKVSSVKLNDTVKVSPVTYKVKDEKIKVNTSTIKAELPKDEITAAKTTDITINNINKISYNYSGKTYLVNNFIGGETGFYADFSFNDANGARKLSDYIKDKYVLLNFWGTWCPPCRAEIPAIIKMQKEFYNKDLRVIGIAMERGTEKENIANLEDFVKKQDINYVNFVMSNEIKTRFKKYYGGLSAVPTTFLIDKTGKIKKTIVGGQSEEEFRSLLQDLIKE